MESKRGVKSFSVSKVSRVTKVSASHDIPFNGHDILYANQPSF
jgi:hypothetical protein